MKISSSYLPPIPLDQGSSTPMYRQLSDWFRRAIIESLLRPGQRVPSTRNLADELHISRITVSGAYELLLAEGYLEAIVGVGTRVAKSIPSRLLKQASENTAHVEDHIPRRVSQRMALMHPPTQTWLDSLGAFRHGVPAFDHFPAKTWTKLVSRHSRLSPKSMMTFGAPMGYPPLREAIAEYLGAYRSVRCDPSQILVTTGSQQGLQLSASVLLDPKEQAWMEEPGYFGAHEVLQMAGAKLIPVPVDQEGLNVTEGARKGPDARVIYTTPSHQYPLGMTMSATRRLQLLDWTARSGTWVIEDDYDGEFRFQGHPLASLQGMDTHARVVYMGTFSKVMFPGLRLGYLVIPKAIVPDFCACKEAADGWSSMLYQVVMADFIHDGHFARHIRRMRSLYMKRRTVLVQAIHEQMGEQLEIIGTDAGMHIATLLPPGIDDVSISIKAASRGISARPLSISYLGKPARSGLILGYGSVNEDEIRLGIRELKACI